MTGINGKCVMIHFRKERDGWTLDVSLKIFSKKTKNVFLSSLLCPDFQKSGIDPPRERERERKRKRKKAAQNRRLFASSFFLKESFNNT